MKKLALILVVMSFVQILKGQSKYQLEPFIYFNSSTINGEASLSSSFGYSTNISGYQHYINTSGESQSENSLNLGLNFVKNSFGFKFTLGKVNIKGRRYFLGYTKDRSSKETLLMVDTPLESLNLYKLDLGVLKRYEIKKLEIDFSLSIGLLFDAMDNLEYNFNYDNQGLDEDFNVKTYFGAKYFNFQTILSYSLTHNFSLIAGLDSKIGRLDFIHKQTLINEEVSVIQSSTSIFNSSFNSLGINIGLKYVI